jgi:hypothetical protein
MEAAGPILSDDVQPTSRQGVLKNQSRRQWRIS